MEAALDIKGFPQHYEPWFILLAGTETWADSGNITEVDTIRGTDNLTTEEKISFLVQAIQKFIAEDTEADIEELVQYAIEELRGSIGE